MRRLASIFLAAAMVCAAGQAKKKTSWDLVNIGTKTSVQVVIQWNINIGVNTTEKISALSGTTFSEFKSVRSGVYRVPSMALDALDSNPDVKFVSLDRRIKKKTAAVGITPATINAPSVWQAGYSGAGVGVAILDSGINQDDNLGAFVHAPVYSEDFTVTIPTQPNGKPGLCRPVTDWIGTGTASTSRG